MGYFTLKNIFKNRFIKLVNLIILSSSSLYALSYSSFIQSDNQRVVSTKYNGYVQKFFVNEGDIIKKGQKLVKIDSKEIVSSKAQVEVSLKQAKLNYEIAQYEFKKADEDYKRYKNLFEKEMISKSEFENVELKRDSLKNQVVVAKESINSLKEQLDEVKEQLNYLDIKANGKYLVIEKNLNVGELATAGTPILVLSDLDELVMYLDIAESDLSNFEMNKEFDITISSINLTQKAKVIAILPRVSGLGSFRIKLKLIQPDKKILPGMFGKVEIN